MKKLLVILMVVAMASFLFVGCLGDGVTPPVDDDDDDDDVGVTATVAPIIIAIDDGALVNAAEADDGIIVNGTGRTYAEIKLYIDSVLVSSGDVEVDGTWIVVVAEADLGADGAKTLYATAEEPGLAVSASSNEETFTLDTVMPSITGSAGKAGVAIVGVAVVEEPLTDTNNLFDGWAVDDAALLVDGIWKVKIKNILDTNVGGVVDTGDTITIETTSPAGITDEFSFGYPSDALIINYTTFIPGVSVNFPSTAVPLFKPLTFADIGAEVFVDVDAAAVATLGYIDVTFDNPVTAASILALTTAWNLQSPLAVPLANTPSVRSTTVARISEDVGGGLIAGNAFLISCSGISDLAGNTILATAPLSDYGIVLP